MKVSISLFFLFACVGAVAQRHDNKLRHKLENLVEGFNGQVGLYVHDLKKNKFAALNGDTVFATASMVKIPILISLFDKLEREELKYHQEIIYRDSLLYAGVDILGSFKNDEKIELSKLVMLMLTMSDNTASLWLQSLAGTGARINELLDSMNFKDTRVNSRTPGRETYRSRYGWGQTTPKEMVMIMHKIVDGEMVNRHASETMLRLLGRNYWDEYAISQIPSDVFVASKGGAVDHSRNEVLYVNGHGRQYIFCICTQNNKDTSWGESNEAWVLTRKLSKLLWEWYK